MTHSSAETPLFATPQVVPLCIFFHNSSSSLLQDNIYPAFRNAAFHQQNSCGGEFPSNEPFFTQRDRILPIGCDRIRAVERGIMDL